MRKLAAWLWLWCLPFAGAAQEFVETSGPLSDEDFYALVSCAAPPAKDCQKTRAKWPKTSLSVGIARMDKSYLGGKKKRAETALFLAIQKINAAGSGITLTQTTTDPDIPILFLDHPGRGALYDTGYPVLDGTPISAAGVRTWVRKDGEIVRAVILFTHALGIRAYESVMLEELMQSLGFLTDIKNPYYNDRSIFAQDSNSRKKLGDQDIMALGRHYPAK